MLDYGTIARPLECVYPTNLRSRIIGITLTLTIALRTGTRKRQARTPLNQKVFKLKDLRELEPQVLSEIHAEYFTEIYRYVRYRISDDTLAEDLASETFLRLLDAVNANKGPNSSIRGWLFGTAANLINDHFRRRYRENELLTESLTHREYEDDTDKFERFEQQDYLSAAINQLTEEQQHVIALRFGSGMTIQETAHLLNKNENAVKSLQYRAIRSLRAELEVEE